MNPSPVETEKTDSSNRAGIFILYSAALMQGLTIVSFPASSAILRNHLEITNFQVGLMDVIGMGMIIVGSFCSAFLSKALGLKKLLCLSLLCFLIAEAALLVSMTFISGFSIALLMMGIGLAGSGFGIASAPFNTFPVLFFQKAKSTALIFLYGLACAGPTFGPFFIGQLYQHQLWAWYPSVVLLISAILFLSGLAIRFPPLEIQNDTPENTKSKSPIFSRATLGLFILVMLLYGLAEGIISRWTVIYIHEDKHLGMNVATFMLSTFWGAITVGRILISFLALQDRVKKLLILFPVQLSVIFLWLPSVHTFTSLALLYLWAGLSCALFFPLVMSLASERFPNHIVRVPSMLLAADVLGIAIGSFCFGLLRPEMGLDNLLRLSAAVPAIIGILALMLVYLNRPVPSGDKVPL